MTELSADVVNEVMAVLDPHRALFAGRVSIKSAVLEPAPDGSRNGSTAGRGKPVRRLANVAAVAPLRPLTLILDNSHNMLWHASDAAHVLHCERYPYFPRVSQARASSRCRHVRDGICSPAVAHRP